MKKKRGIIVSVIVVIVICIIGYGVYSYEAGKSEVNNTSNKSQDYTNEVNTNKNTTEKDNKNYSSKETSNQNSTSSKEDSNQKNVSSNSKNVTQLNNKSSKSSNTQKSESSNNQTNTNQTNKSINNNNTSSNNNSNNNDEAYKKRLKALSGKYQEMESNLLDKYGHNKYGLITPGPGPETTKLETSYYNDWNDVLNSVWGDLKANLPESQMKNLTKQEVEWINSKNGKDIGEQGQMTRDRAVYLLKKYIYQIS
ncbi:hypothetical protein [Clostridium thermobutyricum]|uniref:Lysozyme inhibitor LprI N-terminal domain-containing protein n=1 Tax=Clostridium thermobutyricum DSM 4928 TaxID=1121339 RepID=A0A1V4SVD2_9CLOT|nr:hypothetical protein [Clostridium thermobutyricum]OPX47443.1 hypothetical protein CLTHE_20060 [Clostridium thermobutyricum DSM 4928]